MKNYLYIILCLAIAACSSGEDYDAQGTFEATEVTVSSEANGKIMWLRVEEGDSLRRGVEVGLVDTVQLSLQGLELARQQSSTLETKPDIASQIASLQQHLAGAVTERDRCKRLMADGAATQQQLDNLNTEVRSLEAQIEALKIQMGKSTASIDKSVQAVDVRRASIADQLAKCHISSPIDGVVLVKYAEAGEVAAFGTPLFKVADVDHMYLRAYFTSDQLSALRLGQKVRVEADYGGGNTRDYEGTVIFISSESEFTPKTIQTKDSRANLVYAVKIAVHNDGLLKIGLTGNVYLNND